MNAHAIYKWAEARGDYGITADEAAIHFNCSHNHVAPRISELRALNLLVRSGQKRNTRTGSSAAVLVVNTKRQ